jgi:hypothetical protein
MLKRKVTFPTWNNFLAELKSQLNDYVRSGIVHHLQGLQVTVRDYFPPKVEDFQCLCNPSLCAISARTRINNKTIKGINNFWAGLKAGFLQISSLEVRKLLPCATACLCESGFSRYVATKSKYYSRLNADHKSTQQSKTVTISNPLWIADRSTLALGQYKRVDIIT